MVEENNKKESDCKIWKVPINSSKDNMMNKNMDYKTLCIMTLYSNRKKDIEDGVEELTRFLYKNKIMINSKEIEELSGYKINSIIKNIRKLTKLNNRVVFASNSPNGIVYFINYTNGKGREYITIEDDMLRYLVNTSNSNTIKIYTLLKYMCAKGEKKITREYITEQIGLCSKSGKNLSIISDITESLKNNHFITKRYDYNVEVDNNGKESVKKNIYYKVNSHDEWIRLRAEAKRK